MRARLAVALLPVALVSAGSLSPAQAGGTVTKSWTANAFPPEPSHGGHCAPLIPQARATFAYTVPGPGTLTMVLKNKLDWSADIRDAKDNVLSEADGTTPQTPEGIEIKFKAKTKILMGACNLGGEPSVIVTYTFRPKK